MPHTFPEVHRRRSGIQKCVVHFFQCVVNAVFRGPAELFCDAAVVAADAWLVGRSEACRIDFDGDRLVAELRDVLEQLRQIIRRAGADIIDGAAVILLDDHAVRADDVLHMAEVTLDVEVADLDGTWLSALLDLRHLLTEAREDEGIALADAGVIKRTHAVDLKSIVRAVECSEILLRHFRDAIRVAGIERRLFVDRPLCDHVLLTGADEEDARLLLCLSCGLEDVEGADHVHLDRRLRDAPRSPDAADGGEVNDDVRGDGIDQRFNFFRVQKIRRVERDLRRQLPARGLITPDHGVAMLEKLAREVASDEAARAKNQDLFHILLHVNHMSRPTFRSAPPAHAHIHSDGDVAHLCRRPILLEPRFLLCELKIVLGHDLAELLVAGLLRIPAELRSRLRRIT